MNLFIMKFVPQFILFSILITISESVSNYEYFFPSVEEPGTGLEAEGDSFTLNGKDITLFSGAFHYFRVHPLHWRDTLRKLRAAGLNTVETYMPWNLHNPRQGVYDFGNLDEDMSPFLDLETFLNMAKEEDLFVILRPGPYICSEWDFGGIPSWVLRDYTMHVRTYYEGFRMAFEGYFSNLTSRVKTLTVQQGGPIVAVQIENEYGHFGYDDQPRDKLYLQYIKDLLDQNGMSDALYFTSDTPSDTLDWGALPGVLMTANFQEFVDDNLNTLEMLQPNRPLMVMEYWSGWFDHWGSGIHVIRPTPGIIDNLIKILERNSSVNFYMFIGGTNFGFMAGANQVEVFPYYTPIVTSYDYDAPLTEAGDITDKYNQIKSTIAAYNPLISVIDNITLPKDRTKASYGSFPIEKAIEFQDLVSLFPEKITVEDGPVNMEALDINDGNGQSYGYVLYSAIVNLPSGNESTIMIRGHVRDMAQVLINNEVVTKAYHLPTQLDDFGYWNGLDKELTVETVEGENRIDILVENLGRVNYGVPHYFYQKKGLWEGPVMINEEQINKWEITPMEFKKSFITNITSSFRNWERFEVSFDTPSLYRVTVPLTGALIDTFVDMSKWGKGVVFVNGFNLGRYWSAGPTRTLYLPGPLLVSGKNEFVIFEQFRAAENFTLINTPILGPLES